MTVDRDGAGAETAWSRVRTALRPDRPYVWLAYLPLYGIGWFWRPPSADEVAAAAVGLAVFLWLYLRGACFKDRRALPYLAGILLVAFALSHFSGNYTLLAVYATALAGSIRPRGLAWRAIAAIAVTVCLFSLAVGAPVLFWAPGVFMSVMVGVGTIFTATLEDKNRELERSRTEMQALAAAAERERIARDLHDLLGHTLTVVAVKSDLAARLADRDPPRARREMEELAGIARGALADIRAAVSGMRGAALSAEVTQARRALAAVDVAFTWQGPDTALPPAVEGAFAMLLREGVTNVVRHAGAGRCDARVEVDGATAVLTLADDGVGGVLVPGNGLAGMRQRVQALGGTLEIDGANGMMIRARVPLAGLEPLPKPETEGAS